MIGFVLDALVDRILEPQAADDVDEDVRAVVDPDSTTLNTTAAELDVVASTSLPVEREIAGTLLVRHVVGVVLTVEDGDLAEAARRRDAIVLDLILRLENDRTLGGATNADGSAYVSSSDWTVDYGDLGPDTLKAFASITFTVDTDVTR